MRVFVDIAIAVIVATLLGAACHKDTPTGPGAGPGQFAFVSDARLGQYDICLINTDGSGFVQLTTSLADDSWPTWNPAGTKIAFQSNRNLTPGGNASQLDIYVINADGTGETRLTTDTTNEAQPAWSPDGTKIAFVSDRDDNNEVYVMNADGTGVARLTTNLTADEQPAWSPEGNRLAFDSDGEVWVIQADGSGLTQVTHSQFTLDFMPRWRP